MQLTSSINTDKLILIADIDEYHLLMTALLMLRNSVITLSTCDSCIDYAEALQDHAAETIESLLTQEEKIPMFACNDDDGCNDCSGNPAPKLPDWVDGGDDEEESIPS